MTTSVAGDLRDVGAADVLIHDEVVATLTRHDDDSVIFTYLGSLRAGRTASVSWSLPVSERAPVVTTGGAVPPFFAGLLPEGVRLGAVVSSTKTSFDDHLTLLLAVGADTIGDVRIVASDRHHESAPPGPMFVPDDDVDFRDVFARLVRSVDVDPVALPGAQPKVSAAVWSVPARTPSGAAILKLTPPAGFPQLSENEYFFMRMAAACGLRVPRTRLLHDPAGRAALLIDRFDRQGSMRIPQEDACQVAGVYPASKYRMKTESVIMSLAGACQRGGGSSTAATLELLRTVVFSYLIGNGDLHGKNLSIHAPGGLWQPTPAYDLLTTQPYTGWRDPMALDLFGRANRFRRRHFVDAGEHLGLRRRALDRMLDELVESAAPWPDRCQEIGFDARQTELLQAMLRERIAALGAVGN